jgi:hypothetical protein
MKIMVFTLLIELVLILEIEILILKILMEIKEIKVMEKYLRKQVFKIYIIIYKFILIK